MQKPADPLGPPGLRPTFMGRDYAPTLIPGILAWSYQGDRFQEKRWLYSARKSSIRGTWEASLRAHYWDADTSAARDGRAHP